MGKGVEIPDGLMPRVCRTCVFRGSFGPDDHKIFECTRAEWTAIHWVHLYDGGKCSKWRKGTCR